MHTQTQMAQPNGILQDMLFTDIPTWYISEHPIGIARRDKPDNNKQRDQPDQGGVRDISMRTETKVCKTKRREKRNQATKTPKTTHKTRGKHNLDGLKKRVGYTGSHWRTTAKVLSGI